MSVVQQFDFGGAIPASASLHEAAGRIGALPSRIKPVADDMALYGPALPVRCPPGDNLWIHRALAEAKAGDVLVVDCGPGDEFGYWGEIMATAAIARGVAGLVITGGVRDKRALVALGLPTFSGTVCIQGTGKNAALDGAVGEPVRIGSVTIRRGDVVVGDADGVMVLTPAQASVAVPASFDRDRKEESILEQVRAGALTLDVYNL
ncbi:MAG: 4-hydroxy-4-methyl-2-oxoglutarate aldolase [Sphingopyxis macrogoltabida]|uniref:4-hydroxy-4-methyl-2-oxoglutarate aldolase n=1 Tax=Sphingopyxis macrogoltabida TaxID=33050 RepID=A0A2W5L046_SPHMC|nr:MAG: 4-hydroxy-4-methyl-2-oxoglutarate aldolase [Sphingopyxis macrogoltabida]